MLIRTKLDNNQDHINQVQHSKASADITDSSEVNYSSEWESPPSIQFAKKEEEKEVSEDEHIIASSELDTPNDPVSDIGQLSQMTPPELFPVPAPIIAPVQRQVENSEELEEEASQLSKGPEIDTADAPPPIDNGENSSKGNADLPIQRAEDPSNNSGISNSFQSSLEQTIGTNLSNVNIHENSAKATDVGALAYTQGNDIHFAPGQYNPSSQSGQELIGHEMTHVKQQRDGRVKPTTEVNGMAVNDNPGLEKEADVIGAKAASSNSPVQKKENTGYYSPNPRITHESISQFKDSGSSLPTLHSFPSTLEPPKQFSKTTASPSSIKDSRALILQKKEKQVNGDSPDVKPGTSGQSVDTKTSVSTLTEAKKYFSKHFNVGAIKKGSIKEQAEDIHRYTRGEDRKTTKTQLVEILKKLNWKPWIVPDGPYWQSIANAFQNFPSTFGSLPAVNKIIFFRHDYVYSKGKLNQIMTGASYSAGRLVIHEGFSKASKNLLQATSKSEKNQDASLQEVRSKDQKFDYSESIITHEIGHGLLEESLANDKLFGKNWAKSVGWVNAKLFDIQDSKVKDAMKKGVEPSSGRINSKNWNKSTTGEQPMSMYALDAPSEDFSESIRAYQHNREALKKRSPARFKFIQKITSDQNKEEDQSDETAQGKFSTNNYNIRNENKSESSADIIQKMEASFGTSFSDVNIHKNSPKASNVRALAYTQGTDVHFAPGQFKPDTRSGQELIGHELTHVVQQKEGRVKATTQAKGTPVNDAPALEKEADDMGRKAAGASSSPKSTNTNEPQTLTQLSANQAIQKNKDDEDSSAELELLNDIESGTRAAQGQMQFIYNSISWAEKHKQPIPEGVKEAAAEILRITKSFSKRLTQLKNIVHEVKNFDLWIKAQVDFASKTLSLELDDKASVNAWIKSLKKSNKSSKSYQDAVSGWLSKMGKTSLPYAKLSFVSSVVFAYKDVSVAALDAGLKNVYKYIERHDPEKHMKSISQVSIPSPPGKPLPWVSSKVVKENKERRRQYEEESLIAKKRNEEIAYFDNNVLSKVYVKNRRKIYNKIKKDFQTSGSDAGEMSRIRNVLYGFTTEGTVTVVHKDYDESFGKLKRRLESYDISREISNLEHFNNKHYQIFYAKALAQYFKQKKEEQNQESKDMIKAIVEKIQNVF